MQMRVDEARHGDAAPRVDRLLAVVVTMRADNRVPDNGDVGLDQRAGDEALQPRSADHEVRRLIAGSGSDAGRDRGGGDHDRTRRMCALVMAWLRASSRVLLLLPIDTGEDPFRS